MIKINKNYRMKYTSEDIKNQKAGCDFKHNLNIIYELSSLDYSCRKKQTKMFEYFVLCIVVFFLVFHTLTDSVKVSIENIINKPFGRVFSVILGSDHEEESLEILKEKIGQIEGVGEIFLHISSLSVIWKSAEITGESEVSIELVTAIEAMNEYVIEGKAQLKKGEVLIPKYLYDMGTYNKYTYANGEELLGKEICIEVKNQYTEESREFIFQVAGVYDNITCMNGNSMFCINQEDAKILYEYQMCENQEQYIEQIIELYGITDQMQIQELRKNYYAGFYVLPGFDMEQVCKKIESEIGEMTFPFMTQDDTMVDYLVFILYICDLISAMFVITAMILFVIMLLRDYRNRRRDMAYRYTCGYQMVFQGSSFVLEKLWSVFKAVGIGIVIDTVIILAGNYIIQNLFAFYNRMIVLRYDWYSVKLVVSFLILVFFVSILSTAGSFRKLSPIEIIRKEI